MKDEKEIELKLFFLRYAQEVNITEEVNNTVLSDELMQKALEEAAKEADLQQTD